MDKHFFLLIQVTSMWKLVQVDLNETYPYAAKHYGQYPVQLWSAASHDWSNCMMRECRFAPDVHTIKAECHPMKPERITAAFKLDPTIRWMRDTVNITEDCVSRPFDFCMVCMGLRQPKQKAVSKAYWAQLDQHGPDMSYPVQGYRYRQLLGISK